MAKPLKKDSVSSAAVRSKQAATMFIERFLERTQVDELILTCHLWDFAAREEFPDGAEILKTIKIGP